MIKAVVFDMFETLITHYDSPLYFARQISADAGIPEAKFREIWNPSNEPRTLGNRTTEAVIEEILQVNARYDPALLERIMQKWKAAKRECFRHIHPEIIPMLKAIRDRGIRIGLITNCYCEERDAIRDSRLFPLFDATCMSCEVGLQKPDPAIYEACIQQLGVSPEECLYIGDGGSFELEAAQAMGMHTIQAVWYLKQYDNHPSKRNEHFAQAESPMDIINITEQYT